jgi:hypothetical protein
MRQRPALASARSLLLALRNHLVRLGATIWAALRIVWGMPPLPFRGRLAPRTSTPLGAPLGAWIGPWGVAAIRGRTVGARAAVVGQGCTREKGAAPMATPALPISPTTLHKQVTPQ